jgi:transporter family-2 protein
MVASLALDGFGLLGVPLRGWQPASLAGAAAILIGVYLLVTGPSASAAGLMDRPGLLALAVLAGALLPIQGAINALLRTEIGSPLAVAFISFSVAALAMAGFLAAAGRRLGAPAPTPAGLKAMPALGWLGGFAGAFYVTTVFMALPVIGAASVVALTVAGQQGAALLVDRYGLLMLPRREIVRRRLSAVALLFAGVLVVKLG